MEKEENKILVHEKILQKVEETYKQQHKKEFERQNRKVKFSINVLSYELQDFFYEKLKSLNSPLYSRINDSENNYKGLSPDTIGHAWKSVGKPTDGAIKDLRDLLCYYGFGKDWLDTLESLGVTEEDEIQRTKDKREEHKCKNEGKPYISKSESEIKKFANNIYIELITRKAAIPLEENKDVIEEVYNSWYALFKVIREEIKKLSFDIIKNISNSESPIGISLKILNDILRPHLTEHQAKFRSWLEKAKQNPEYKKLTPQELQKKYPDYKVLMKSLKKTNEMLIDSAEKLCELIN